MADSVPSIVKIEDFFQDLTLRMLNLNPTAPASQKRVRTTWPTKGAPAWKITEDVTFLLITFDDDSVTRQMDVAYLNKDANNANRIMSYTRVIRVNWICYGPHSSEDADTIRSSLFLPQIAEQLLKNNMALITDVSMPMRTPELFNGQWWERASLFVRFNEKVVRQSEIPYITSADVRIIKEGDNQ